MKNSTISRMISIVFISTCICFSTYGQQEFGFKMPSKRKKIKIPFKKLNNLIIIPVTINHFLTLNFILDTGVETAILTDKLFGDVLEVNYIREMTVAGPGIADSVEAYIANQITFGLSGGILGKNMNMIVLKEDYLKLSEATGEDIHGIIGYDIFSRFVVEINYDEYILVLTNPQKYKRSKRAVEIPIEIRNSKPFINAIIKQDDKKTDLDMMVDTGASHAALIDYAYVDDIEIPKNRIVTQLGRGITGEIHGYIGRVDSVSIGFFDFGEMLVSAPFEGIYNKAIKRGARVGTLGGELLSRFHVTFNYSREKMYLRKGRRYNLPFEYDMSGMEINAVGTDLNIIKVVNVDKGRPAYQAGIRKGDIIISINGKNLQYNDLSDIYTLLQSGDGKKIKVKISREGEKMKTSFRLDRII